MVNYGRSIPGRYAWWHGEWQPESPPYKVPVPIHTFTRQDAMPLVPGQVTEITFDLQPVSYLFQKGYRIRVAIAGADRDNFGLIPPAPATVEVLRSIAQPSHSSPPLKLRY